MNDVNLDLANLKGADLSYADLSNAHLRGADLSEVILEGTILTGAVYDEETQLPFSFKEAFEKGMLYYFRKSTGKDYPQDRSTHR